MGCIAAERRSGPEPQLACASSTCGKLERLITDAVPDWGTTSSSEDCPRSPRLSRRSALLGCSPRASVPCSISWSTQGPVPLDDLSPAKLAVGDGVRWVGLPTALEAAAAAAVLQAPDRPVDTLLLALPAEESGSAVPALVHENVGRSCAHTSAIAEVGSSGGRAASATVPKLAVLAGVSALFRSAAVAVAMVVGQLPREPEERELELEEKKALKPRLRLLRELRSVERDGRSCSYESWALPPSGQGLRWNMGLKLLLPCGLKLTWLTHTLPIRLTPAGPTDWDLRRGQEDSPSGTGGQEGRSLQLWVWRSQRDPAAPAASVRGRRDGRSGVYEGEAVHA